MKKTRRIVSLITSLALAVSALTAPAYASRNYVYYDEREYIGDVEFITSGTDLYDDSDYVGKRTIRFSKQKLPAESGVQYTTQLSDYDDGVTFKIRSQASGILTISFASRMDITDIIVTDANKRIISAKSIDVRNGTDISSYYRHVVGLWNSSERMFACVSKYNVNKGTYYIHIRYGGASDISHSGSGKFSIIPTFPIGAIPIYPNK